MSVAIDSRFFVRNALWVAVASLCGAMPVGAQILNQPSTSTTTSSQFPSAGGAGATANAQEPGESSGQEPGRTFSIVPRVSVTATATNNVLLDNSRKVSDLATEVTPGVRVTSNGGRLKGFFDYSLTEIAHSSGEAQKSSRNALNTQGTLEAWERRAFVDFSGVISQQAISAFGTQSLDNATVNTNRTEVSNYRLSPYLRGNLSSTAEYELRYSRSMVHNKSDSTLDNSGAEWLARLKGDSSGRAFRWTVDAISQRYDFTAGRSTEADRLRGTLAYVLSPQLNVSAIGGYEASNYLSLGKEGKAFGGAGVQWTPSERTRLNIEAEGRQYGGLHSINFEHRSARTVWRFADVTEVSGTPGLTGTAGLGSVYDLVYSQMASVEPDPIQRAVLVNAYLKANGLNPNTVVTGGFLASSVAKRRRQELSFVLMGLRDTVTVTASRNVSQRLDSVTTVLDDFSNSDILRSTGLSVNYAHRLTPTSTFNVIAMQQRLAGSVGLQGTTLRTLNLNVSSRLGMHVTGTVGARRTQFESVTIPYSETAVVGSLLVQF